MPSTRKEGNGEHSILIEMLAIRLQQLEEENGGYEALAAKIGIAKSTQHALAHGRGNPTLRTIERIASNLNMSVLELLGFDENDARRSLKRNGIDYDELVIAIDQKNKADLRIARKARVRK
jgi:transcriptional regulator with XRE-family HTH domain